jgi:hypothetical protein
MERAQALQILASPGQCHMLADNLRDVHPVSDLVDDVVRNQAMAHGGPRLHTQNSTTPSGLGRQYLEIRFKVDRTA